MKRGFVRVRTKKSIIAAVIVAVALVCGGAVVEQYASQPSSKPAADVQASGSIIVASDIPEYEGVPYITINGNLPSFTEEELASDTFEYYGALDKFGRCTQAFALVGEETMPTAKRENISSVRPTGWHTDRYSFVDGEALYNRCHLLGFKLTGENANDRNLITGTRYMNVQGMLPFEDEIANYIYRTGNHVLYRVTPVFEGNDLIAQGVQMEAYSVEDGGKGVCFNVFCYNVQPDVVIDYANGDNHLAEGAAGTHYGAR